VQAIPATAENIREAARHARAGRLIVFPTDTVYAIGSDATNDEAMAALFAVKARPKGKALIVLAASTEEAARYGRFDERARRLADTFWPGPLSLILPRAEECPLSPLVSAATDTVALRVPNHEVTLRLIVEAGCPLAAPSANLSGEPDAGPPATTLASTLLDLVGETALLRREGALDAACIEGIIGAVRRPDD
jgi:L-threonylcarbamoyladenylate synthase